MTQKLQYDSRAKAEKNNRVGMLVRTGDKNPVTGKRPVESLHSITASAIAKEHLNGEPVWVATIELVPASPEQIKAIRANELREEKSGLLYSINNGGGWNATDADTLAMIARFNAIKNELGE